MTNDRPKPYRVLLDRLTIVLADLPWLKILAEAWKAVWKVWQGVTEEGMYEVLEYEATLELQDKRGEHAIFRKCEKVRYLQNGIIAYQDQAWGDGQILVNYRCTPGVVVDRYRPGQKTYLLISLREVKSRGDMDEFHIEWEIRRGFVRSTELWETEVSHRTRRLKIQVIFPKSRPPLRIGLTEYLCRRTHLLEQDNKVQLPDGRWLVFWETDKPHLHERYMLRWNW